MRLRSGLVLACVLIFTSLAGSGTSRAYAQASPAKAQAQRAAEDWLALVDAGRYGESYDRASQSFRAAVTRTEWVNAATSARATAGRLVSRRLVRATETRNPPQGPPGDYVVLQYQSSFTNLRSASETVVPVLERDGAWRVSTYTVR
jgi:Protein of unknown function (DUF4019)